MQDSFLVDSCILLYLADKRDMKKHLRAIKWLEGVETKKLSCISLISIKFSYSKVFSVPCVFKQALMGN